VSGKAVIRHLLSRDSALLALLAQMGSSANSVVVGQVKIKTVRPAISVRLISGTERLTVAMNEARRMRTQRIQVTVHCTTPKQQEQLIEAVLVACPNTKGTLNGTYVDAILPDGEGPDLSDPDAGIYEQSRDFIVKWLPAAA
jgi:DNA-binding cell septation regulator SpoVG